MITMINYLMIYSSVMSGEDIPAQWRFQGQAAAAEPRWAAAG